MLQKYVYEGKAASSQEIRVIINETSSLDRVNVALGWVEGEKVLDVGCGLGYVAYAVAQGNKQVCGVDFLPSNMHIATTFLRKGNLSYCAMDASNLGFDDGCFDCVLCLEVLEHLKNPSSLVDEVYRVLKQDGCLIVSTPNATSASNIFKSLGFLQGKRLVKALRNVENEKRWTGTQLDHMHVWDIVTLQRLLNRSGFSYVDHAFTTLYMPIIKEFKSFRSAFHENLLLKVRKTKNP
jgi:2-polyprenyl-3-methyl-5-hydroxy-6-metoxy-1,4-benzoquinol methylase